MCKIYDSLYSMIHPPKQELVHRRIIAKLGDKVTCKNGHVICDIGRDLCVGQMQAPGDFINWQQKEPTVGDPVLPCEVCGDYWWSQFISSL
jgi:hypothetical protein